MRLARCMAFKSSPRHGETHSVLGLAYSPRPAMSAARTRIIIAHCSLASLPLGLVPFALAERPYANCTEAHQDNRYDIPQDYPTPWIDGVQRNFSRGTPSPPSGDFTDIDLINGEGSTEAAPSTRFGHPVGCPNLGSCVCLSGGAWCPREERRRWAG